MRPRFLSVLLVVLLGSGGHPPTYAQASDPEMERGVRQAQEGEFEQAIVTLRSALPRMLERKAPQRDIARVHVYLGVAQLGLNDPATARTSFVEAIRIDPALKLSSEEYPPRIVRAFEEARRTAPSAPATAAPPATGVPPTAPPGAAPATPAGARPAPAEPAAVRKGGSKLPLVLLGVGAVGGGVALAAGAGGGESSTPGGTPPVTAPPVPTGTVNLIASFPPAGGSVQLSSDPRAGSPLPEITFDVTYGADVAQPAFEINLWRGPDLCFSTQVAYATRLDTASQQYSAGTTARYRVAWWSVRQPGCGNSFVTDRFEFFWGRPSASLFIQNLSLGWSFSR
jgi:hypothetical protein